MKAVRVLAEEEPASGEWNMAVDAVLLRSAVDDGVCSLRWYRWREPTLSLGYFQPDGDPLIDGRFSTLPRVRRLSGGGALLHDREFTYSCAVPAGHRLAAAPGDLYVAMHAALANALKQSGLRVETRGTSDRSLESHFLCFNRSDANDLVFNGHKILGSAQRRRRGAVLQHGGLLVARSEVTPEFPGLLDFKPDLDLEQLWSRLIRESARVLAKESGPGELTAAEQAAAEKLVAVSRLSNGTSRSAAASSASG